MTTTANDYQQQIEATIDALDLDAISEVLGEQGCDQFLLELGNCRSADDSLVLFEKYNLL